MSESTARDADFEAAMVLRINAVQYWLTELFSILANDRPGLMAARLQQKLHALKNEPPLGPPGITPEQLDQIMLAELPAILAVGAEMVDHLEGTQLAIDARRAAIG